MFVCWAESGMIVEVKGLLVELGKQPAVRRGFGETANGDMDEQVIVFGDNGPQSGIEHPVGVGREGEAVARIVVAAFGVLMNVGRLDYGAALGVEPVTGEGTGEVVATENVGLEPGVTAFFLPGFECGRIGLQC